MSEIDANQMSNGEPFEDNVPPSDSSNTETAGWLSQERDHWLDRMSQNFSDRFNPIVVKEARQSLKSNQFTFTLLATLGFGLLWSLFGMSLNGYDYSRVANNMLMGYVWILGFPLALVVPFSTFRSMAAEREDQTYDLIAITTLRPMEIVWGKLASALLQILIYVSILTPCIIFTYMLRGIELWIIMLVTSGMVGASICLCCYALLFGTLVQSRAFQIVLTVMLVLALGYIYIIGSIMFCVLIGEPYNLFWGDGKESSALTVGWFLMPITYAILSFVAAASRLKFVSDNRSTGIRWTLLFQQFVFISFVAWIMFVFQTSIPSWFAMFFLSAHWWMIGSIMIGERTELSERTKRGLPKSALAQTFFAFLMPGPGRGLLFCFVNVLSASLIFFVISAGGWYLGAWTFDDGPPDANLWSVFCFQAIWPMYTLIYLSFSRVFVELVRKRIPAFAVQTFSFLFTLLTVLLAIFIPIMIALGFDNSPDYTPLQIGNPFWTSMTLLDADGSGRYAWAVIALIILSFVSMILFIYTMFSVSKEILLMPTSSQRIPETENLENEKVEPFDPLS